MSTLLPVHPVFGRAIGLRRNGSPIWTIRGASSEGDPPNPAPAGTPPAGTPPASTTPPATPPAPPADPKPADPDPLGDGGKKALEAERAARKAAEKAQREAEAKVKTFEDAQKTEAERNADRIRTLEKDAAKALRYEAAAAAGIPLTSAHRLQGDTLEALTADAEAYKAEIGGATPPSGDPTPPPPPKPDRRQGGGEREPNDGSMSAGKAAYRARKEQARK